MTAQLTKSLEDNPFLDAWIAFDAPSRTVRLFSGKVELGQGATTGIAQMAAHELYLPISAIRLVAGDTRRSPNEGITSASRSIELGGASMRIACAEVRNLLTGAAAEMLEAPAEALGVKDGVFVVRGQATNLSYWDVAPTVDLHRPITGVAPLRPVEPSGLVGKVVRRLDLEAKFTGGAFIQDLNLPDMLHARVVRAPRRGARLRSWDGPGVEALPDVSAVVRDGGFLAVTAETEEGAIAAHRRLAASAMWDGGGTLPSPSPVGAWLDRRPSADRVIDIASEGEPSEFAISARYTRPPLAHASIGLSCGVAWLKDGHLTVWSHSQGVFGLRDQIVRVLSLQPDQVSVVHANGSGCYGHNGADDAAFDAALLATLMPERPVRVLWTREDELTAAPFGSPMQITIAAALGEGGRVSDWRLDVWSGHHSQRPGTAGAANLLAASELEPPWPFGESIDLPFEGGGGGLRNAVALYGFPRHRVVHRFVPDTGFRLSALRSLGAFANVFAIESFMDELAEQAGEDPVAFRLKHLSDPRARAVIERVAMASGWQAGAEGLGLGRAKGLGFSRYKNQGGYAAVVAEVEAEESVRVRRVWCAVDTGLIVNPDGLLNQVQGGIIQAISWTLKEAVTFDSERITSRSWADYPILGFSEVPEVEVFTIETPGDPSLGAGEVAAGPTAAAVGNAVARALGVRVRDLPITRDRILDAMS